jgi:hypothetical protein
VLAVVGLAPPGVHLLHLRWRAMVNFWLTHAMANACRSARSILTHRSTSSILMPAHLMVHQRQHACMRGSMGFFLVRGVIEIGLGFIQFILWMLTKILLMFCRVLGWARIADNVFKKLHPEKVYQSHRRMQKYNIKKVVRAANKK